KENYVNEVIKSVESDDGGDCGHHAGGRRCSDSRRAAFHGEAAVTSDSGDQETKNETLQYAGDNVANQQRIGNELEKIGKSDAEISAANQAAGEHRRHVRHRGKA